MSSNTVEAYPKASVWTFIFGLIGGVLSLRLRTEPFGIGVVDRRGVVARIGVEDRLGVAALSGVVVWGIDESWAGGSEGGRFGAGGLKIKALLNAGWVGRDVGRGPKGTAGSRRLSRVGRGLNRGTATP